MKQINFKRVATMAALVIWTFLIMGGSVTSQTISVLTTGLKRPAKVIRTEFGNLLVAEEGTGIHDGRISVINAQTGARRTLLDGLPSAAGRYNLAQGPSGLVMRGRTLYITIGEGNPTVACDAPCEEIPNPAGASSPIFSSVLALNFSSSTESGTNGFTLTPADDFALKNGEVLNFNNGNFDTATLKLVTDFHDFAPDPIPGAPQNVAASNPFGIEIIANHLYVTDGGMNNIWKVDINSGETESLITFPTLILPAGARIEAVPTGIRAYKGQLLVALLRGGDDDPLAAGLAEIRLVDPQFGSDLPFIAGLTSAIDVLPVETLGFSILNNFPPGFFKQHYFYVLEFGVFAPPIGPGRKPTRSLRFNSPDSSPVGITDLGPFATGMTRDPVTGDLYVARMFAGAIARVRFP